MKKINKKTLIIIGSAVLLVVIGILSYFIFFKNDKTEEPKVSEECVQLTGGSYTLKINKNNNEEVEEISVCISCSPDSYTTIETPTYDGYTFVGWYYDSDFKEQAEIETTLDIEPVQEKDSKGCVTGYKTIEIFAKWEKVETETKEETKTETKKTETKSTTKTKTAKCPSGYTLSNNVCTMTTTVDATPVYTCSEGTLSGTKCVSTENTIYACSLNNYVANKGMASSKIVNGQCQITYKQVNLSDDAVVTGDLDWENMVCKGVTQGTCTISVASVEYENMCNSGYTYSNGTCRKETNASVSKYTCSEGTLSGTKCTIVKTTNPTYE